jgi:hypothetical protein
VLSDELSAVFTSYRDSMLTFRVPSRDWHPGPSSLARRSDRGSPLTGVISDPSSLQNQLPGLACAILRSGRTVVQDHLDSDFRSIRPLRAGPISYKKAGREVWLSGLTLGDGVRTRRDLAVRSYQYNLSRTSLPLAVYLFFQDVVERIMLRQCRFCIDMQPLPTQSPPKAGSGISREISAQPDRPTRVGLSVNESDVKDKKSESRTGVAVRVSPCRKHPGPNVSVGSTR